MAKNAVFAFSRPLIVLIGTSFALRTQNLSGSILVRVRVMVGLRVRIERLSAALVTYIEHAQAAFPWVR